MPGDKSISHRAALIAALADGDSLLHNFSTSDDCRATLNCLAALGAGIQRRVNDVTVSGRGLRGLSNPSDELYCGNSGSSLRMLAGLLAAQDFTATLTGDDSLRKRPMQRIVEPLELMGARISSNDGHPPLVVQGTRNLHGIEYELPIASAQLKTCLLLAGLQARGGTRIIERSAQTRDHTERMLKWFGVPLTMEGDSISIDGPVSFSGRELQIPGDFSAAAFIIAAATLLPGSDLEIEDVGLNPTRTALLRVFQSLGLSIDVSDLREDGSEPSGRLRIRSMSLGKGERLRIHGPMVASLIDELPLLAVVGSQLAGADIRDASELRLKETDRISATVANLRAMGATVEEYDDGLSVDGPVRLEGARLNSFGDHRIAMAFTVAALLADVESELIDSECVSVSFPEFYRVLESLVER